MMRFDRFTADAQDAAARAYEIVQRYTHTQVDTEHVFLALLEQSNGLVPQMLNELMVEVAAMKDRLDQTLRSSLKVSTYGGGVGQIFYTPRIRAVLELSQKEANGLEDEFISTEHIFLAILNEHNTPSWHILQEFDITRGRVLEAIRALRVTWNQPKSRPGSHDPSLTVEESEINIARLQAFLGEYFSLEELRVLCSALDVDDEAVSRAIKGAFARELVREVKQDGRLWELVRAAFTMD